MNTDKADITYLFSIDVNRRYSAASTAVALDTLRRGWISLISSRAAGAADLSPRVFLPPAGLNHIEAQALGTLDGEAVYFTRSMRWFSGTRVCWTRMLPDRSEGLPAWRISRSAPCQEVQYRRNATFPAQGDNCRRAPRRAAPSWLDWSTGRSGNCADFL